MRFFKKKIRLEFSNHITAIDGRVIARKGDRVNQNFLEGLIKQRPAAAEPVQAIASSPLFSKFEILLQDAKYQFISDFGSQKDQLFNILAAIRLSPIVMQELTWMERYAYHYHHCLVIAALVARMTLDFYQEETKARQAASCALTHDFGITRVPEKILQKVSPLDEGELKIVREHPIYSYVLLIYYGYAPVDLPARVGYEHHENMLGTGYPRGVLPERKISQFVQIGDIFDALISARPFRPALSTEKALETITAMVDKGEIEAEIFTRLKTCVGK